MALSNLIVGQTYTCNGSQTTFAIPFDYTSADQINVYLVEISTGVVSTLSNPTDYTNSPNDIAPVSIVMNTAPSSLYQLRVQRATSLQQIVEYINNSAFLAEDHEKGLDRIVAMVQELALKVDNAIQLPIGDYGSQTTLTKLSPDKFLTVNALGNAVINTVTMQDIIDATYTYVTGAASAATEVANHAALTATHGVTGAIVGTSDTQALTNKTISGASNTLTNIPLTTAVTGTLPIANGGTGLTSAGSNGNILKSNGSAWVSTTPTLPTIQKFTSGSGTYTPPANAKYWIVEMVGAGGGGGGGGSGSPGTGGAGGSTTFSGLTAAGGSGGSNATGGAGGAASGSPNMLGVTGGRGASSNPALAGAAFVSGSGGNSILGGGSGGQAGGGVGTNGETNTGGGGSGGSVSVLGLQSGSGGGAGAGIRHLYTTLGAVSYSVGVGGTAGTAGTSGAAGGTGGSGYIIVQEFYT